MINKNLGLKILTKYYLIVPMDQSHSTRKLILSNTKIINTNFKKNKINDNCGTNFLQKNLKNYYKFFGIV